MQFDMDVGGDDETCTKRDTVRLPYNKVGICSNKNERRERQKRSPLGAVQPLDDKVVLEDPLIHSTERQKAIMPHRHCHCHPPSKYSHPAGEKTCCVLRASGGMDDNSGHLNTLECGAVTVVKNSLPTG